MIKAVIYEETILNMCAPTNNSLKVYEENW